MLSLQKYMSNLLPFKVERFGLFFQLLNCYYALSAVIASSTCVFKCNASNAECILQKQLEDNETEKSGDNETRGKYSRNHSIRRNEASVV